MYVPFSCGYPVRMGNVGNTPAGIVHGFSVHRIWEIENPKESYGAGTENHGKTDISMGIVWVGMGTENFYTTDWDGNVKFVVWLGGTTGTIVKRERELSPFPDNPKGIFLREFSRGLLLLFSCSLKVRVEIVPGALFGS